MIIDFTRAVTSRTSRARAAPGLAWSTRARATFCRSPVTEASPGSAAEVIR